MILSVLFFTFHFFFFSQYHGTGSSPSRPEQIAVYYPPLQFIVAFFVLSIAFTLLPFSVIKMAIVYEKLLRRSLSVSFSMKGLFELCCWNTLLELLTFRFYFIIFNARYIKCFSNDSNGFDYCSRGWRNTTKMQPVLKTTHDNKRTGRCFSCAKRIIYLIYSLPRYGPTKWDKCLSIWRGPLTVQSGRRN